MKFLMKRADTSSPVSEMPKREPARPVWSGTVRSIALVGLVVLFLFVIYLSRDTLPLVIISALVAYLISPFVRVLNRRLKIRKDWAIIIAYILLILLIGVVIYSIIPWLTQNIKTFVMKDWPELLARADEVLSEWRSDISQQQVVDIFGIRLDLTVPISQAQETIHDIRMESIDIQSLIPDIMGTLKNVFSFSTNIFSQVMTGLILVLTSIMASFHFCKDGYKLSDWVIHIFEEKYQMEVRELLHRLGVVWNNYFVGELKLMLWIGVITCLAFWALGIRWAFLLGIIAGFCEVVPNIGPILACVPAAISALLFGSSWIPFGNFIIAVLVVIVSVVIQQTENIFLVPHIMGNALELHPAVLIIGIMVLSSKLGIIGAVFAAPIIGLSKEILSFIIKKIKRQDPYPELYTEIREEC